MSLIINTWRDPYNDGFSPTRLKRIIIDKPITVLVGCNGAGKTTLIKNIKSEMKKQKIPCHMYDNLSHNTKSFGFDGNLSLFAELTQSSEGEGIKINIGRQSTLYKEFMEKGEYNDSSNRLIKIFKDKEDKITTKTRVLLYDAADSGLSVDGIIEIKSMFDQLIKDSKELDVDLYIIISANEYELCRDSDCFDVNQGKYIEKFKDYEEYRKFIIKSRLNKEKRIERQKKWREKQREKELNKLNELKEEYYKKKKELLSKEKVLYFDKHKTERKLRDFIRSSKFISDEEVSDIEWL